MRGLCQGNFRHNRRCHSPFVENNENIMSRADVKGMEMIPCHQGVCTESTLTHVHVSLPDDDFQIFAFAKLGTNEAFVKRVKRTKIRTC